jgi:hypothetical protein
MFVPFFVFSRLWRPENVVFCGVVQSEYCLRNVVTLFGLHAFPAGSVEVGLF